MEGPPDGSSSSNRVPDRSTTLLPRGRRGPPWIVGVVALGTVGAIYYSHYAQERDKAVMRAGVERDKERLKIMRRQQRELLKQQQKDQQGQGREQF
jgi:PET assembly of cytochrome c oxidase, mitochondrial